ncbi:hypothetical protein [Halobacillus kuroshimensis]|nr:hypothetical protein [Halobacillus kuroshimensis]
MPKVFKRDEVLEEATLYKLIEVQAQNHVYKYIKWKEKKHSKSK